MPSSLVSGERASPPLTFEESIREHVPAMRRLALVAAAGADADDIVQEALLRGWRRWSTYRAERGSVRTWLLAITSDQARRWRQRRRGTWVFSEVLPEVPIDDALPDLDLRRAVNTLPTRQRQAVLLYYYVDLSVADVASVMGCSPGTVKSSLADARAALTRTMGGGDA